VEPLSTGVAYGILDRLAVDKIPMTMIGYGRSDAANGKVFPYVFPLITSYWNQAAAMIKYLGDKEGGIDKLKGKKIVHLYHDSAFGKEPLAVLEAFGLRDLLLFQWQTFFQTYGLVILPTLADLPPTVGQDLTFEGQDQILNAIRPALICATLGLAGLAVPVGSHGALRTGVQIIPPRLREDLALEAGEVIEAAEGVVVAVDPA
jgi:hypothetical protein